MAKVFIGNKPHPDMQAEFVTELDGRASIARKAALDRVKGWRKLDKVKERGDAQVR